MESEESKVTFVPYVDELGQEWRIPTLTYTNSYDIIKETKSIPIELYDKLDYLGIIPNDIRETNVGNSNYSTHVIQPWSIWLDYPELTSFDCDIIKRVLRTKKGDTRIMDYEKIIHICNERIRQLKLKE